MTVHYIVLNPFGICDQKSKKEQQMGPMEQLTKTMQQSLQFMRTPSAKQGERAHHSNPIFLGRNHRKMKQLRKCDSSKIDQKHGLIIHPLPAINCIKYQPSTEDQLQVRRVKAGQVSGRKRKSEVASLEQSMMREDIRTGMRMKGLISKRVREMGEMKYLCNVSVLVKKIETL
jgi:hypothetical protein